MRLGYRSGATRVFVGRRLALARCNTATLTSSSGNGWGSEEGDGAQMKLATYDVHDSMLFFRGSTNNFQLAPIKMSTRGANSSTRSSIRMGHVESFGKVRSQTLDTQIIRGEDCAMDTGTFQDCTTNTLAVTSGITTPRITLNGEGSKVILATSPDAFTGTNGVIIGSTSSAADNTIIIGANNVISGAGAYSIVLGHDNTGAGQIDGDHNIVLGRGDVNATAYNVMVGFGTAAAVGDFSCVFGRDASSSGTRNVVVGNTASVDDDDCVAIGSSSNVTGAPFGVAIGFSALVTGDGGVCIGANTNVLDDDSIALGNNSTARGRENVAIGKDASTSAVFGAVSIGRVASADGEYAVAIGSASSTGGTGVSIGKAATSTAGVSVGADASSASGLSIGTTTTSSGSGIAVGGGSYAFDASLVVGSGSRSLASDCSVVGNNNISGLVALADVEGESSPGAFERFQLLNLRLGKNARVGLYTVVWIAQDGSDYSFRVLFNDTVIAESITVPGSSPGTFDDQFPATFTLGLNGTEELNVEIKVTTEYGLYESFGDIPLSVTVATSEQSGVCIGNYSQGSSQSIVIGERIASQTSQNIVIGQGLTAGLITAHSKQVIIGTGCKMDGTKNVIIGTDNETLISPAKSTPANASNNVCIGVENVFSTLADNNVIVGASNSNTSPTAPLFKTVVIGSGNVIGQAGNYTSGMESVGPVVIGNNNRLDAVAFGEDPDPSDFSGGYVIGNGLTCVARKVLTNTITPVREVVLPGLRIFSVRAFTAAVPNATIIRIPIDHFYLKPLYSDVKELSGFVSVNDTIIHFDRYFLYCAHDLATAPFTAPNIVTLHTGTLTTIPGADSASINLTLSGSGSSTEFLLQVTATKVSNNSIFGQLRMYGTGGGKEFTDIFDWV